MVKSVEPTYGQGNVLSFTVTRQVGQIYLSSYSRPPTRIDLQLFMERNFQIVPDPPIANPEQA